MEKWVLLPVAPINCAHLNKNTPISRLTRSMLLLMKRRPRVDFVTAQRPCGELFAACDVYVYRCIFVHVCAYVCARKCECVCMCV
jgi:hypothetical protein